MLLDYQQGGMILDGMLTFPDWTHGGIIADETINTVNPLTLIVLRGSATGPFAGSVKINVLGTAVPLLATITPNPDENVSDEDGGNILDENGSSVFEDP